MVPELVALWAGLTIYAAAFIAEIVRAAILSVHKGQREAALSLGLQPRQVLSKIILPQALRVMIPPMTSQYLNIIKSSSLGAAVAYPELFQIFAGTVLQQYVARDRDDVPADGDLPVHQSRHLGTDELVQSPRRTGGTMSATAEQRLPLRRNFAPGTPGALRDRVGAAQPVRLGVQYAADTARAGAGRADFAAAVPLGHHAGFAVR